MSTVDQKALKSVLRFISVPTLSSCFNSKVEGVFS